MLNFRLTKKTNRFKEAEKNFLFEVCNCFLYSAKDII